MNINITLIIQAGNFFIAYLLIRFLLFKPVVAFLKKEWDEKNILHTDIVDGKKSIADKTMISDQQWLGCRHYFSDHAPKIEYMPLEIKDVPPLAVHDIPQDKVHDFQNEVARTIIKKVDHVR